jgi:hypothetical protein
MYTRWMRLVGLLLLAVYTIALVHQILPHDLGHGSGEFCSLCVLLTTVAILTLATVLLVEQTSSVIAPRPLYLVSSRHIRHPFSLRGPPSAPF